MSRSAVIFDLDGTLTRPTLDFDAIRAEIGLPKGPILESMRTLDGDARVRAESILDRHEWEAARNALLYEGAVEIVSTVRSRGGPVGLLTRNGREKVDFILGKHGFSFDAIRTREDGAIKPSAAPFLSICREVGADPTRSWMVGDYLFDIQTGRSAGATTVLMIGDGPEPDYANQAHYVIRSLGEMFGILWAE